jgi:hypothetical protein
MNAEYRQCIVTTGVSDNEEKLFTAMARDVDVSCNILMRRLIRYLLEEKISWTELCARYKNLTATDTLGASEKKRIRTTLPPEQYTAFAQLAENWGSSMGIAARRLIQLYIAGKIERRDIW